MQRGSGPGARDICLGDAQRGLPLAHAVAQLQPGAESGDPGRLGLLHGDQQLVGEAVGVEVPASSEPLLPALAGSRLLHRPCGERAVARRRSARSSSLRARRGLGRGPPLGSGCRGARDRSPPAPHAQRATLAGSARRPGAGASLAARRSTSSPSASVTPAAAWVRCRPLRSRGLAALRLRGLFVARVSALNRRCRALSETRSCGPASFAERLGRRAFTMTRGCWDRAGWRAAPGGCVLLGGDHDQRAVIELAGGLGALEELSGAPDNSSCRAAVYAESARGGPHLGCQQVGGAQPLGIITGLDEVEELLGCQ